MDLIARESSPLVLINKQASMQHATVGACVGFEI